MRSHICRGRTETGLGGEDRKSTPPQKQRERKGKRGSTREGLNEKGERRRERVSTPLGKKIRRQSDSVPLRFSRRSKRTPRESQRRGPRDASVDGVQIQELSRGNGGKQGTGSLREFPKNPKAVRTGCRFGNSEIPLWQHRSLRRPGCIQLCCRTMTEQTSTGICQGAGFARSLGRPSNNSRHGKTPLPIGSP